MDEEAVRPKARSHEVGQDLSTFSIDELKERIEVLQAEIARLEAAMQAKEATKSAADNFFRR